LSSSDEKEDWFSRSPLSVLLPAGGVLRSSFLLCFLGVLVPVLAGLTDCFLLCWGGSLLFFVLVQASCWSVGGLDCVGSGEVAGEEEEEEEEEEEDEDVGATMVAGRCAAGEIGRVLFTTTLSEEGVHVASLSRRSASAHAASPMRMARLKLLYFTDRVRSRSVLTTTVRWCVCV
jgi:hypothetical protein